MTDKIEDGEIFVPFENSFGKTSRYKFILEPIYSQQIKMT